MCNITSRILTVYYFQNFNQGFYLLSLNNLEYLCCLFQYDCSRRFSLEKYDLEFQAQGRIQKNLKTFLDSRMPT